MLMEAFDSPDLMEILNHADMITPDGMPLVWMLRCKGQTSQERVYGPTLMLHVLEMASRENIPVGFYGGDVSTLEKLISSLRLRYPGINVAYAFSPPYRPMDKQESDGVVAEITRSGARILFVGLGCPKQEIWIAKQKGRIPVIMLAVGAAFDFHAGLKSQAPDWMQRIGLEWLFRFIQEPRRLWRRYLYHNPRFVILALLDLLNSKYSGSAARNESGHFIK